MWLIEQGKFLEAAQLYRQTKLDARNMWPCLPAGTALPGFLHPSQIIRAGHSPVRLEAFRLRLRDAKLLALRSAGWVTPSGKKVAIVGAGPAGLSCAEQLLTQVVMQSDHIYDSKPVSGGPVNLWYSQFQITERSWCFCRWNDLEQSRRSNSFQNTYIGKDKSIDDLLSLMDYDGSLRWGWCRSRCAHRSCLVRTYLGVMQATEFLDPLQP